MFKLQLSLRKQTYLNLIWSIHYWPTWNAVLFKNEIKHSGFNINVFKHGDPVYIWQSKDIRVQCMVRIWKYNHQMTVWLACHMKQWWSTITLWLLIKTLHFYSSSLQIFKCNEFNKIFFLNLNHDFLLKENPLHFFTLYIYCWHKINYARVDLYTKKNTRKHLATTFFNPEGTLNLGKKFT